MHAQNLRSCRFVIGNQGKQGKQGKHFARIVETCFLKPDCDAVFRGFWHQS